MPKVLLKCAVQGCNGSLRGYDIEAVKADDGTPLWIVWYVCREGHEFNMTWPREEKVA